MVLKKNVILDSLCFILDTLKLPETKLQKINLRDEGHELNGTLLLPKSLFCK
jgi:hypothetical protein